MTKKTHPAWRGAAFGAALATVISMAAPAQAGNLMLDFDDLGPGFLGVDDSFSYQGLQFTAASGIGDAAPGDLVGAIFDGNDPGMCQRLQCPTDNFTPGYYAGLNDGALAIKSAQPAGLHVKSFDASFIGSFERYGYINYYPDVAGLLEVRGYLADGSYRSEQFQLNSNGGTDFSMAHFETSAAFAGQGYTNIAFFAYSCNFAGDCQAFHDNAGQFALDNLSLNVSAVPEPETWLMLLAGLGTVAALRRRRSV